MKQETEALLDAIKKELPRYEEPRRVTHTLGVLKECRYLADFYGLCEEEERDLCVAALLHDLAKSVPEERGVELLTQYEMTGADAELSVRHQYIGAPMARDLFGETIVTDTVFSAIACHTTGKPAMSVLDKMLFIADFTEPGRKYRSCIEMREYLHEECGKISKSNPTAKRRLLDEVTKKIVGFTIIYLIEKGKTVDIGTIFTWNDLVGEKIFGDDRIGNSQV